MSIVENRSRPLFFSVAPIVATATVSHCRQLYKYCLCCCIIARCTRFIIITNCLGLTSAYGSASHTLNYLGSLYSLSLINAGRILAESGYYQTTLTCAFRSRFVRCLFQPAVQISCCIFTAAFTTKYGKTQVSPQYSCARRYSINL